MRTLLCNLVGVQDLRARELTNIRLLYHRHMHLRAEAIHAPRHAEAFVHNLHITPFQQAQALDSVAVQAIISDAAWIR